MRRLDIFIKGSIYHICNKSIAHYGIFQDFGNAQRFITRLDFYNSLNNSLSFSQYERMHGKYKQENLLTIRKDSYVKFLAYCIMPDHYHLLVKINANDRFSEYIGNVENSYSKYFNNKHQRKGPLWQSRFRSIKIKTNEQLLHVSRYIHLNPTTNNLVLRPEDWELSSYNDFITNEGIFHNIMEISIKSRTMYKGFVENQKDYQRKLKKIKKLLLE